MYLIEFVTDRYSYGGISKIQVGYKESEESAKEYCERKTKELEGTYNDNMMCKYYQFRKLELLKD